MNISELGGVLCETFIFVFLTVQRCIIKRLKKITKLRLCEIKTNVFHPVNQLNKGFLSDFVK